MRSAFQGPSAPNPLRSSMTRGWLPIDAFNIQQQDLSKLGISGPEGFAGPSGFGGMNDLATGASLSGVDALINRSMGGWGALGGAPKTQGYAGTYGYVDVTALSNRKAYDAIMSSVVGVAYPGKTLGQLIGAVIKVAGDDWTYEVVSSTTIRTYKPGEAAPAPRGPKTSTVVAPSTSSTSSPSSKPKFDPNTIGQILASVIAVAPTAVSTVKGIIESNESLPQLEKKLVTYKSKLAAEKNPAERAKLQAIVDALEAKIKLYKDAAAVAAPQVAGEKIDTGVQEGGVLPSWLPWAVGGLILVGGAFVLLSGKKGSAPRALLGA